MGTLSELERRAGLGSSAADRTAFWLRFHHLEGQACLDAGVAELRRMIAQLEGAASLTDRHNGRRLRALTADEEAALQIYAARHGRRWKSTLNNAWMGGAPHDDAGTLRRLRNTHGPSWLHTYRLPKARLPDDGNLHAR